MNRHILFDPTRCIGCRTCEALCKSVHPICHHLTGGWIEADAPVLTDEAVVITFRFMHCTHCLTAPCIAACPVAAIGRQDDVVLLDEKACTGCGACVAVCPQHAVRLDQDQGKAIRCDLCHTRPEPACVTGCTARALRFIADDSNA